MAGVPAKNQTDSNIIKPIDDTPSASGLRPAIKNPTVLEEIDEDEIKLLQHDLATARKVQEKLIPEKVPQIHGYDFAAHFAPAGSLSGDYYDFIQFDKNHLGIVVADASGKGMAASMLMIEARMVIRAMSSVSTSPREILCRANRVLLQDFHRGMFVTLFYALLDIREGTLRVASAGHLPMLLWKWKSKKCFSVNPAGLVLGAANQEMFDDMIRETNIVLERGDRFVLYTDGVTELMDYRDEEFGKARFVRNTMANATKSSKEYVQGLVKDLDLHRSGFAQSDDITIVTGRSFSEEEIW